MTSLSEFSGAIEALVEATARRVVAIDVRGRSPASGIIWHSGLIVTAHEAIGEEERFDVVLPDGKSAQATPGGRDPSTDVALLRVESGAAGVGEFKPAAAVNAGSLAIAVGRSGNGPLASSGIVKESGASWHSWAGGLIDRRILLDLALDRRAHGGAVINASGELIGIAAFAPRHQALVIPVETVDRVAERLKTSGRISRGYLGVSLHPARAGGKQGGAMVVGIDEDGPGKRAGLFAGDILTAWNGEAIAGVRDVYRRLGPDSVGMTVVLDVIRANQPAKIEVVVGERPHK